MLRWALAASLYVLTAYGDPQRPPTLPRALQAFALARLFFGAARRPEVLMRIERPIWSLAIGGAAIAVAGALVVLPLAIALALELPFRDLERVLVPLFLPLIYWAPFLIFVPGVAVALWRRDRVLAGREGALALAPRLRTERTPE